MRRRARLSCFSTNWSCLDPGGGLGAACRTGCKSVAIEAPLGRESLGFSPILKTHQLGKKPKLNLYRVYRVRKAAPIRFGLDNRSPFLLSPKRLVQAA